MANDAFFQALNSIEQRNKDRKTLPYRIYYRENGIPYKLTIEELPEPNIIIKNYQARKFTHDKHDFLHYRVEKNKQTGEMELVQTYFPEAHTDYRNVHFDFDGNRVDRVDTVDRDPNFPRPGYKPSGKYSI